MAAQERLHTVEQRLAVQVEEEHGEQCGVDAQSDQDDLFKILNTVFMFSSSSYQLIESSNSSKDGSSGSSCMTVVM